MQEKRNKPIILTHRTSLAIAIKISKTRVFKPRQSDPLGGDSGMNVFEEGRTYYKKQEYGATGADIRFEWTGPCKEQKELPFDRDCLIRQNGWRSIVPFGTSKFIRMIAIKAELSEWEALCAPAPWWLFVQSNKNVWLRSKAAALENSVKRVLSDKPSIGVGVWPLERKRA